MSPSHLAVKRGPKHERERDRRDLNHLNFIFLSFFLDGCWWRRWEKHKRQMHLISKFSTFFFPPVFLNSGLLIWRWWTKHKREIHSISTISNFFPCLLFLIIDDVDEDLPICSWSMSSSQIWLGFHFASAYKEVAEETKDLSLSKRVEIHKRDRRFFFLWSWHSRQLNSTMWWWESCRCMWPCCWVTDRCDGGSWCRCQNSA